MRSYDANRRELEDQNAIKGKFDQIRREKGREEKEEEEEEERYGML